MVRAVVAMAASAGFALQSVAAVMDVGEAHVCATVGSTPKCWGANAWGQLGREDNTTTNIGDDPDELGDNLVGVDVGGTASEIALGGDHSCILLDSGDVVCFGQNDKGQLGLEDTVNRGETAGSVGETVNFGTGLTAVAITSGCEHTCGLLDDGSVKCFGYNNFGQLGQGTTDNVGDDVGEMGDDLAAVSLTGTVSAIAAGCDFTCALMDDGSIMCWGRNTWGQLGTGDSDDRLDGSGLDLVAVDLDGSVATSIAGGEGHVCALLDDASVKCWGRNNNGQLGQGDELDRGDSSETLGANLSAISLGTGDVPTAVDCGSFHTCVLLDDGSVKCFGANGDGELGTGTTNDVGVLPEQMGDSLVAVDISGTVSDVAAGGSSTCAVTSDDAVTCWGRGNDGQLGQGDDENILDVSEVEPVDLGTDVLSVTPAPGATLPVGSSAAPTMAPVTLAPLGPGETFAPTPAASDADLDVDAEGSGAPAHFDAGLVATVTLGAVGFMGALFL